VFTSSSVGAWSQQGEKLTGSGESGAGELGRSVALSADGNTALIGGPADNVNTGAAWIFTRSQAAAWSQQGGKLAGGEGEEGEGRFGSSVALSADGNTALIGGPADNVNTGAAWAFVNHPTVSSVTPNKGPEAGGTSVTITGTNFNEAAAVEFGSIGATSYEVISATSITAVAPAGAGAVDVSVTTSGGTSATGSADKFSYVPPPAVVTKAASSITQTTATLNATVNPNGGDVSSCTFEYGTTEVYETSVPCSSLPGAGAEPVAVSAALENLSANTTYHFRIVAASLGGTSIDMFDAQTFETLPEAATVVTEAASSTAQTTATLNATVNPNGGEVTSCQFDYGTSEAYGKSVPCSSSPGSGSTPVAVSAAVVGLSAHTTYHFRIVATNSGGAGEGADVGQSGRGGSERDGESERWHGDRLPLRLRHDDRLRVRSALLLAAWVRRQPGGRVRVGDRSEREHDLSLPGGRDERHRHRRRWRWNIRHHAQSADGRYGVGLVGDADERDVECDRQPQRRRK
jgi:hypothetical protein